MKREELDIATRAARGMLAQLHLDRGEVRRTWTVRLENGDEYSWWARSFSDVLQMLRAEVVGQPEVGYDPFPAGAAIASVSVDPPLPGGDAR